MFARKMFAGRMFTHKYFPSVNGGAGTGSPPWARMWHLWRRRV
jgi:hypothetical protein